MHINFRIKPANKKVCSLQVWTQCSSNYSASFFLSHLRNNFPKKAPRGTIDRNSILWNDYFKCDCSSVGHGSEGPLQLHKGESLCALATGTHTHTHTHTHTQGDTLNSAEKILLLLLTHLQQKCLLNIITFGSSEYPVVCVCLLLGIIDNL